MVKRKKVKKSKEEKPKSQDVEEGPASSTGEDSAVGLCRAGGENEAEGQSGS